MSDEIFDVTEDVEIGDLTDVKQEKDLLPPTKDVRFRIKKASVLMNKDATYRQINLQLVITEGIQVGDVLKYRNKPMFAKVCYYADPDAYTKDYFKKRQHLVQLKMLCVALGEDLTAIRINDEFLTTLVNKELLARIVQKKNTFTTKSGDVVDEMVNDVVDFKKAEPIL